MVWCKKAIVMNGNILECEKDTQKQGRTSKSLEGNYFGMENMALRILDRAAQRIWKDSGHPDNFLPLILCLNSLISTKAFQVSSSGRSCPADRT